MKTQAASSIDLRYILLPAAASVFAPYEIKMVSLAALILAQKNSIKADDKFVSKLFFIGAGCIGITEGMKAVDWEQGGLASLVTWGKAVAQITFITGVHETVRAIKTCVRNQFAKRNDASKCVENPLRNILSFVPQTAIASILGSTAGIGYSGKSLSAALSAIGSSAFALGLLGTNSQENANIPHSTKQFYKEIFILSGIFSLSTLAGYITGIAMPTLGLNLTL